MTIRPLNLKVLFPAVSLFIAALAGYCPASRSDEIPQIRIDEIEFAGVTVFKQPDLEPTLQIAPGDRLEKVKVIKTAENIQSLYRVNGYEQTSIRSRLFKRKKPEGTSSVLAFEINEGLPTRIASIHFVPTLRNQEQKKQWDRIAGVLLPKTSIHPKDILNQDQIASSRRLIQEVLATEEFVGGQIGEVSVSDAPSPGAFRQVPGAARWVKLEFKIDLGDRVTFGFRGNEVFSSSRLNSLVEEQKLIGLGKDYIGAIRAQIESLYKSIGYAKVRIIPYTFENQASRERHVTYLIEEGPRVTLHSIRFDGNIVFPSEELEAQFYAKAPQLTQRHYYVADEIQKSAELLVEWIKSKGYLASKLVTINLSYKNSDQADLVIYLFEGEQTIVQNAQFSGISAFSPQEVRNYLGVNEGEPLNLFKLSEGIETLKSAYRSKGYLQAKILNEKTQQLVQYSSDNRLADVAIDVSEGPLFRLSKLQIDGAASTKPNVILREIEIKEGEVLGEQAVVDAEVRLRKLGIFSMASIRTADDPERQNYKLLRVSVQESIPGLWAWGFGYRNDLGARAFTQVSWANLWGRNHTLSFNATINRRIEDFRFIEGQTQVAYIWPWFAEARELTLRPAVTFSADRYLKFSATTISFTIGLEKPLLHKPNLMGGLTYSLEKIHQFVDINKGDDPLEAADFQLGAITPGLQLDLRDNPLSPRSGYFGSVSFEISNPMFLSQSDPYPLGYTRLLLRNDFFQPLPLDMVWYFSLRGGFERSTEQYDGVHAQSGAIPTIKTFTLGGPSSLRGFKEQQLNLYQYTIRGSAAYVNYRTQIDIPISGGLNMGPFLDAASLFTDPFADPAFTPDRVLFEWRYGGGVGFHYQTPIGPVNLDWGFNLKPKVGEDPWRFHFSIGVI